MGIPVSPLLQGGKICAAHICAYLRIFCAYLPFFPKCAYLRIFAHILRIFLDFCAYFAHIFFLRAYFAHIFGYAGICAYFGFFQKFRIFPHIFIQIGNASRKKTKSRETVQFFGIKVLKKAPKIQNVFHGSFAFIEDGRSSKNYPRKNISPREVLFLRIFCAYFCAYLRIFAHILRIFWVRP